MPINEVRYYLLECDECGNRYQVKEIAAGDDDLDRLIGYAEADGWDMERDSEGRVMAVWCNNCDEEVQDVNSQG